MSKYIKKEIVFGKCHLEDEKHVILCGDKEYIQYCGITLSSVILSNPNMNFVFNIFCDDVSDNDLEKLRETSEKFNRIIKLCEGLPKFLRGKLEGLLIFNTEFLRVISEGLV